MRVLAKAGVGVQVVALGSLGLVLFLAGCILAVPGLILVGLGWGLSKGAVVGL